MKKGWKIKRLADVLELQNGYAFDSKGFNPTEGLPLIRIRSLKAGVETETRFNGDYDKKYVVKAGDLLIGMDGEFGCYDWKGEPALLNQRVCRLQGFSGELIPRFLFYGVNDYLKAIEDVTGYTTVKHISSKQILEIEFPVPPLAEQRRIVGLLDEAFAGLATAKANAEKNLQNARALFESHLNDVFTKKGDGWLETTIGGVCDFRGGGTPSKAVERYWKGKIPWVSPKDMKSEIVSDSIDHISQEAIDASATSLIPKGAVLMVVRSGILARIVPLAVTGRELTINQDLKALCPKSVIESRFLYNLLESKMPELLSLVSRGATVHRLQTEQIRSLGCFLPPKAEQHQIIERIDSMRDETQRLARLYERKQAALEALKKSLRHLAFTGEL